MTIPREIGNGELGTPEHLESLLKSAERIVFNLLGKRSFWRPPELEARDIVQESMLILAERYKKRPFQHIHAKILRFVVLDAIDRQTQNRVVRSRSASRDDIKAVPLEESLNEKEMSYKSDSQLSDYFPEKKSEEELGQDDRLRRLSSRVISLVKANQKGLEKNIALILEKEISIRNVEEARHLRPRRGNKSVSRVLIEEWIRENPNVPIQHHRLAEELQLGRECITRTLGALIKEGRVLAEKVPGTRASKYHLP